MDAKTKYQLLRSAGKLNCTIKQAIAIHDARHNARILPPPTTPRQRYHVRALYVRLSDATIQSLEQRAKRAEPRKKNWQRITQTRHTRKTFEIETKNHGRYSSRCTYNRYTYRPIVHASALILTPTLVAIRIEETRWKVKAPRGYHWWTNNGALLAIAPNSAPHMVYIPTDEDLRHPENIPSKWRSTHYATLQRIEEDRLAKREKRMATRRAKGLRQLQQGETTPQPTTTEDHEPTRIINPQEEPQPC